MARLIIKNGYIKGGTVKATAHIDNLVKYIATRDGVEKVQNGKELWSATQRQQTFIAQLVSDFPDSKDCHEYDDYMRNPNRENATEFITMALEQNLNKVVGKKKYLDYIANRPRVEKIDTHGLFSGGTEPLLLAEVARELSTHQGNLWTPIISLRREDAQRLGYESAAQWQAMLQIKAMEIAASLKIPPAHFHWYAAFHNEGHHPHIHMICYSTQPQEGFLSRQGIAKMKSAMAREIFKEDLLPIYAEKTVRRTHTKQESKQAMHTLLTAMSQGVVRNEKIEQLITHLAQRLQHIHGKKQYGYLHANLKNIVDEIVDELGREDSVAKAYHLWWEMQASVELTYTSTPSERLPLSKCAEFKSIKNMVIQEAMHIAQGNMCFEETAKEDNQLPTPTVEEVGQDAFYEGKRYITGDGVMRDIEKGLELLMAAAEQENHYAEYALGVLYLKDEEVPRDIEKAMDYLQRAAEHGSDPAQYRLGKLYLSGDDVPYDAGKAFGYFIKAAAHGNANAQYTLGKMYQAGTHVEQDTAQAEQWFRASAKQGNQYAQFFVDNKPVGANPSVFTAATRLLHHASRVFAQQVPLQKPIGFHIDRKRRLKLSQMKQNRGHKPDDHAMELSL